MVTNNISELIAALSPEKYALFAKRLIDEGAALNSFPLSFAQERIWFITQLDPDNSRYNAPFALRLKGRLDVRALELALNEVTRRHEILRTIFTMIDGEPMQVVLPAFAQVLPVTDLRALPEKEREQAVLRITVDEGQKLFNLSEGPLVRTHLLRLKDDEHVIVRTEHHIISDASSQEIFMREVTALYTAYSNGKRSPLSELHLQYADFAVWQRKWLQGEKVAQQLNYWKRQLAGDLPVLNLPADKSRPAQPSFRGAIDEDTFPASLTTELEDLSRRAGVTMFITLLAAFQTLLHRYTAESDISVGTPILNRNRVELESVMGFFGNTLVMRSDLSGNPSFYELLKRVREVALGAYAHQDVPFEQVARAAQPERSLSYASLVQVMFTLQNGAEPAQHVAGLTWSSVNIDTGSARFDLMLSMRPMPAGLGVMLQYATDLFNAGTSKRMLVHLRNLLEGIVRHPERRLSEFSLLSESERQQILVQWNDTARDYTLNKTLHALFEEQVTRTPDAPALSFAQQHLTYAELNARANQLARHLRQLGVKPESCVGIMMERSIEMVVSLWAVLKAGGVYVPLDPAYPRERLSFMLEDSAVPILLTQQHLHEQLPAHHATVLCVDSSWSEIARQGIENLESGATADNLAYVIYTSGSTGRPKGAMISHRGITNRLIWMQEAYQLTGSETVLQKTPFSFDVSVWEFFWPMLVGARLVLAVPGGHQDSAYLVRLIREEEVTTLHFVPSMLQVFLETHGVDQCTSLRRVICSGEALSTELRQRFFARMKAQLHNLYGPTEASVDVTFWECQPDEMRTSVPIGRPIANTQIYILDHHLQPVPAGVAGELYIGGVGLGRGYLRRPELTAEKFVPDPFSTQPGERLYRTGDQARHLHDGEIEFLGRLDHQVKLRGFRIELGEIEAALAQHPSVSDVAVVVREEAPGDKRLASYLVIRKGKVAPNISQLRDFLQSKLPDHMVPATFMFIDALPLTPSGKLDRRALPTLAGVRPELQSSFVAPRTHAEQVLAAIWSDVLRVERVGVHDDFFDLGGDSILSIQVVSRANQEGLSLRPRQIFQHHTVAQLAVIAATAPHVKAEEERITGPVPLTPIQRWFFEQDFVDPQHFNQAVMLKVEESLDASLLAEIVAELLQQHDALRLRFIRNGEEWQQIDEAQIDEGIATTADVFRRVDLRHLAAEEQRQAIEEKAKEFQRSLDLTHGPLIKIALFELGDEKASRLLIVIHHLVVDGVSWRILLEDLEKAYRQRSSGERINLGPKTTSFKEWSQRLEQHQQSTAAKPEFDYWHTDARRQIKPLPRQIIGGLNTVQLEQSILSPLGVEETHALLYEVNAAYHTQIYDILLTALLRTLSQWTGERRVLIDLEGHGREDIVEGVDVSRTVGWFTTIFPVLLEQEGLWHPGETLKLVKEQLRAIPRRGIGYGLVRYLSEDESIKQQLRELPRSEVIFNYLGQLDGMFSAAGGFSLAPESAGAMRSSHARRTHLLDISASIIGERLQVAWSYSKEVFHQQTIERLAAGFNEALRGIIAHCLSTEPSWTPSDFPLAKLNDAQLQRVLDAEKDVEDIYVLSPMQEGMLFQSLFEAGTGVYLTQVTCELSGELDTSAFAQSWQQVVNRHDSLRTSFQWDGLDAPVQIVNRHVEIAVEQIDWRGFELAEQQEMLEVYLKRVRQHGFKLNEAPLLKLTLFRTGDKLYRFVWICHHLLVDGWSVPIIIGEVLAIYDGLLRGEQPSLGESRAYRDFIEWLSHQDVSSAEAYWLATLHGHKYPTAIQTGKTNETLSDDYGEQQIILTTEETTRLHAAAKRLHVTLNTLVQGAWALLLSRYSNEEDVIFGVTSSGRPASLPGVEKIVGDFISTLPARVRVQSGALVGAWLQELQAQQAEQRQFEYSTLAQVHGWSDIPRNVRMFDSILIYENYPAYSFEPEPGRQLEIKNIHAVGKTNYPLTVLAKGTGELLLKMWYASSRFDDDTISRMLGHFRHALQNLSADPDQRLDDVTFMSEAEIQQLGREAPSVLETIELEREAKFIPPGTPAEDLLATIWANVLHLEQVGRNDDFFELGGHSLLANQVMSRVRETFGVEVPLSTLFEYPTLEYFASRIEDAMRGSHGVMTAPVERVSREQDLPLSFAQQRLWFLNELEPGSFFYNIPVVLRLKGQLNLAVLEQTLSEIIRRHEVLRTTFGSAVDGTPSQHIAAHAPFKLTIDDLSALPSAEREAEVISLATAEAQAPFDLARGPLLRISLLRLADEEHIALVTLHHIISDGWSTGVFIREVAALYEAYNAGKESPLGEIGVQYADYAVWQREWLSGAVLEEQLGYWREQLGRELTVLDLPTDRPRPPVQSYRGMHQSLVLSSELSTNLKALCRREGVTLYMALLGAFQILLHRYTRQTDIVVGTPIAGRNRAEIEGLIGFFVNTLVLRTDLSGDPSFRDILQRVRAVALGAYAHQDLPFEKLVEELQPERDLSRHPLFQVMFETQNEPEDLMRLPNLVMESIEVDDATAKFDLTMLVGDHDHGLSVRIEYSVDLFDAETIIRMGRHFETLLTGMVADPARAVADVTLLTDAEREQLKHWNDTTTPFPHELCFHQLFAAQVERTPDAVAAAFADQRRSYLELDQRTNQLARYLQAQGVRGESRVGVYMDRGLDLLESIIAIFKAGCVYVPLDPGYPKDRLAFLLSDAEISLLLTSERFAGNLPNHSLPLICVDADWNRNIESESADALVNTIHPTNLAYVIYTSGSTGQPKGAMIEHRGMVNHLLAKIQDLQLSETDIVAQTASQTFDISIWQLLVPLLVGGRVEIFNDEIAHHPLRLFASATREQVTILEIVPALLQGLLEEADAREICPPESSRLRWLILTGDALPPGLCRQWMSLRPDVPLLNAYGPTECSDDVTHYAIYEALPPDVMLTPIGRPLANTRLYVADEKLRLLPVGMAGELYVGGVGVGRGYLNKPELTAERFVPDPFASEPGARLYKTGDLARFLSDGNIEFLGRLDHQVKVRGFRIELGEIESALRHHEAVREAVVMVSGPQNGEAQLSAYVVPEFERLPAADELRNHLKKSLPEYMIPASFVMLEALPLTRNGKIDRRALAQLETPRTERVYVAPRTAVEEVVSSIWAEVLKLERVGVHDGFFDLGGHSLLSIQVLTRLHKTFHVDLPLRAIFEADTVAELSKRLVAMEAKPGQTEKIARIVQKIGSMSIEDKQKMLQQKRQQETLHEESLSLRQQA